MMPESFPLAALDTLTCFLWVLDNVLLVCASAGIAARVFPADLGSAKILNITIISCAILTAVLLVLGAANIFNGVSMMAAILIISLAVLWGLTISRRRIPPPDAPTLTRFWILATGLLCGHCIVNGLLKLPRDHDCLMYHLPLVDSWLQAGSLYAPDVSHWSNPAGSELFAAWCCGPFSGDFLSPLNNLPVVIVWAAATLQFCRLMGMSQRWPELATISALCLYTLLHETDDASNDLMVVAFFMASNVYVLRAFQTNGLAVRAMTGICLGLLCGVKFFALGYAAVTWTAMIGGLVVATSWRTAVCTGLSTAILSLAFGGYWYIRNIFYTGLPLYPMGDTASISYPNLWETSLLGNQSPVLWPMFFEALWTICGPIHWFAAVLLPFTAIGLTWKSYSGRKNESPERAWRFGVSAMLLIGSTIVLSATPYLVEDQPGTLNHLRWMYTPARYGLCFLTISVVCMFVLLQDLAERLPGAIGRLWFLIPLACLIYQLVLRIQAHSHEFLFVEAAIVGIDIGFGMMAVRKLLESRAARRMKIGTCLTIVGLMSIGAGILASQWHVSFDRHFDLYFRTTAFTKLKHKEFDCLSIVVLDYRPYAFYGSRRQHHVINPRRFVSTGWLSGILNSTGARIVTALGDQEYSVDRYRGAFELLTGDKEQFRPFVESLPLVVSYYANK